MSNPFARYAQQPSVATSAPSAPGVIYGRPKAPDPYKDEDQAMQRKRIQMEQERFQYQMQRDADQDAQEASKRQTSETQAKGAAEDAALQLRNTIRKIDKVSADTQDSWTGVAGLGETGVLGAMQGGIPGSAAYSLRKDLKTVDATQVLQAMTRLKELSPTGSTGFGALSAPELELLRSSVANLDPDMDQETFMENLTSARKTYSDMLIRIEGGGKSASELLTDALLKGKSREELIALAKDYGLTMDETALDANLRSRASGGRVSEVRPPADIEAIMAKYGAR